MSLEFGKPVRIKITANFPYLEDQGYEEGKIVDALHLNGDCIVLYRNLEKGGNCSTWLNESEYEIIPQDRILEVSKEHLDSIDQTVADSSPEKAWGTFLFNLNKEKTLTERIQRLTVDFK